MAPQELEKSAGQYATNAIKYDSQGAREMAITHYQKAIESLLKLQRLYPDSQLNKIYAERMKSYQDRIKALQTTQFTDAEPVVNPAASPEEQRATLANRKKNNFETFFSASPNHLLIIDDASTLMK